MFFFAGRSIFNKIEEVGGRHFFQSLASWGGFTVQNVALSIQPENSFLPVTERLKRQVLPLEGRSMWSISPQRISHQIQSYPSVDMVSVRRLWPDRLQMEVRLREPRLALRARDTWIFIDRNGYFLATDRGLKKQSLELPQVYGLEDQLVGEIDDMNRVFSKEQLWLKDLVSLVEILQQQVGLSVWSVSIRENLWARSAVFEISARSQKGEEFGIVFQSEDWKDRISSLQFVLSDLRSREVEKANINAAHSGRLYVETKKGLN